MPRQIPCHANPILRIFSSRLFGSPNGSSSECAYYYEEEAGYNSRISWYGRKTWEKTGTFSLKVNGGSVKATLQFKTARYIECTNLTNFNGDVQTTDHIDETQTFNIKLGGELKEG